jgi:hypothetical protein
MLSSCARRKRAPLYVHMATDKVAGRIAGSWLNASRKPPSLDPETRASLGIRLRVLVVGFENELDGSKLPAKLEASGAHL